MIIVVKAMCVLSDPEKRKHYDIKLGIKLTNFDIKDTTEIYMKQEPVPKQQEKRRAHTNNDVSIFLKIFYYPTQQS